MISLEELKRLHKKANKFKLEVFSYTTIGDIKMTGISTNWKNDKSRFCISQNIMNHKRSDMELLVYLRNHCEEIIKILEERDEAQKK